MHTSGSPRSAHSRCTCIHRGPVGSHATVTRSNPFDRACAIAQSSAGPSWNAFTRTVRRESTRTSWSVTARACLSSARSIPITGMGRELFVDYVIVAASALLGRLGCLAFTRRRRRCGSEQTLIDLLELLRHAPEAL